MKVLALDYGRKRTGVAVSDPTGTLARPLGLVEDVWKRDGLARLLELIRSERPARVVVGLPVTLSGREGEQAEETRRFVETLERALDVPVDAFDERFTTVLAQSSAGAASMPADARAAAHLLSGYLAWLARAET